MDASVQGKTNKNSSGQERGQNGKPKRKKVKRPAQGKHVTGKGWLEGGDNRRVRQKTSGERALQKKKKLKKVHRDHTGSKTGRTS